MVKLDMQSTWKEAATVILASMRRRSEPALFNYDLLSIKRSAKNSFMPGTHVFPGGATHPADGCKKWLELFKKFNINPDSQLNDTAIPPILMNNNCEIPKLAALKITAIRETFEETGVLLCLKESSRSKWISSLTIDDLNTWRSKIANDGSEFLNLCDEFNCCPNIDGLHLWCNWLTPRSKPKRFDTLFFLGSLQARPPSVIDNNEVDEIVWCSPEELLRQNEKGVIILPPPQLYELSRLVQYTDADKLTDFAQRRAPQGCERWMPQYLKVADGAVSLLPGDGAYDPDGYEGYNIPIPSVELTMEEHRLKYSSLHRFEGKKIRVKNYNPKCGHILPVS